MYAPVLELESFEVVPLADRLEGLGRIVDGVVHVNRAYLRAFPKTPGLYESGVRFRSEAKGTPNRFADIPRAMMLGGTHCVGLSAWRVAELLEHGERARIQIHTYTQPNTAIEYHVLVKRGDGSLEDPSRILGMRFSWE